MAEINVIIPDEKYSEILDAHVPLGLDPSQFTHDEKRSLFLQAVISGIDARVMRHRKRKADVALDELPSSTITVSSDQD